MRRVFQTVSGFILIMGLCAGSHAVAWGNPAEVEVRPGSVETRSNGVRLPAPGGIRAIPRVSGVTLGWKEVPGSTGYRIYWAKAAQVTRAGAQVTEVGANQRSCTLNHLLPGISYGFKVCALRTCEEGRFSRQVVATPTGRMKVELSNSPAREKASEGDWLDRPKTTNALKGAALPPPKGFRATPRVEGALLEWKPVAGGTGYRIYWEFEGHVSRCSNKIEDLPPDQASYWLRDLSPGGLYRFRVCTLNASTEGALSREAGVRPKEAIKSMTSDAAP